MGSAGLCHPICPPNYPCRVCGLLVAPQAPPCSELSPQRPSKGSITYSSAVSLNQLGPSLPLHHPSTESAQLEGTHKEHQVQLLGLHSTIAKSHTTCPKVLSICCMNFVRLGTAQGRLFQCPITLWVKNISLISNLNLL